MTVADHALHTCFSRDYAEARQKFLHHASLAGAQVEQNVLPGYLGAQGELLSMDVARLGSTDAERLVILSSGVHGPEGFAGSGCQVALLRDEELQKLAQARSVALLVVHAVNPYGFSHLQRTNEDNIDLNRNFIDFDPPTENPGYAGVHDLLLPTQWPPTADNIQAQRDYVAAHGESAFRDAVSIGQSAFADGMFYSGTAPSWSNRTLRQVLRTHGASCRRIAWIDVHTGLGPWGHGEKIHGGRPGAHDNLRLARATWGADVVAAWEGDSTSQQVIGHAASCVFSECPHAESIAMALEYGTEHRSSWFDHAVTGGGTWAALRASQWMYRHPNRAGAEQRAAIRRAMRDGFYADDDTWRGMVAGQCRTALVQACLGLST